MIRLSSNQKTYDEYYSRDEAFVPWPTPPGKDADEAALKLYGEQLEEHTRKVEVARETSDWTPLLIENGEKPTKFILRPLPGDIFRIIVDMVDAGDVGGAEANLLLLRAALRGVKGLGQMEVTYTRDPRYPKLGAIATVDVPNALDAADNKVIAELASVIRDRAVGPSKKS